MKHVKLLVKPTTKAQCLHANLIPFSGQNIPFFFVSARNKKDFCVTENRRIAIICLSAVVTPLKCGD